MTFTLSDFAEPGDRVTDFTTGERYIVTDDNEPTEGTLERAIWRGDALIALGADDGEPEETQLSDVLADLMHWANHNHVDWDAAIASAERSRTEEIVEWQLVCVAITNTYEDGHESESKVWVTRWEGDEPDDDWWSDVVNPHTGDGTGENLEAFYEATITHTASDDSQYVGQSYDWQG